MKKQTLKIILSVLVILLIILVGIGGIYVQEKGSWKNVLPEYQFATDLKGYRSILLKVAEDTSQEVSENSENTTTENTAVENMVDENATQENNTANVAEEVNSEDKLTLNNFVASKKVVEERLKQVSPEYYYSIKQDSYNGNIFIQMVDSDDAEELASVIAQQGKFRMVDDETSEELLTNADVKKAKVGYSTNDSGYVAYLNIEFNKQGKEKLREISKTYVKTTEGEGENATTTTKKIALKIDDETILTTYFAQEITDGVIQLSIGQATTSYEELQKYMQNASRMAVILQSGEMPLSYSIEENAYNGTYLTTAHVKAIFVAAGVVLFLMAIYMVVALKGKSVWGILTFAGYIASLLLVLRFTNVYISLETMAGIVIASIMGYMAILKFFTMPKTDKKLEKQFIDILKQVILCGIPIAIIAITLCFAKWLPLYNFGMAIFWGAVLTIVYNTIFTRTIILNTQKREEGK